MSCDDLAGSAFSTASPPHRSPPGAGDSGLYRLLRTLRLGAGMTAREREAYNAGVSAMLALARATSDRLALQVVDKPTHYDFAIGTSDGLTEEGAHLLRPVVTEDV